MADDDSGAAATGPSGDLLQVAGLPDPGVAADQPARGLVLAGAVDGIR